MGEHIMIGVTQMNSSEIVTALEVSFKLGKPFTMPAMSGKQLKEVWAILGLGK